MCLPFFFPTLTLPPSLPNRNSASLLFRGNLFGKISSVPVGILELEEDCDDSEGDIELTPFPHEIEEFPINLLCE